jgi:hypothetical protein
VIHGRRSKKPSDPSKSIYPAVIGLLSLVMGDYHMLGAGIFCRRIFLINFSGSDAATFYLLTPAFVSP